MGEKRKGRRAPDAAYRELDRRLRTSGRANNRLPRSYRPLVIGFLMLVALATLVLVTNLILQWRQPAAIVQPVSGPDVLRRCLDSQGRLSSFIAQVDAALGLPRPIEPDLTQIRPAASGDPIIRMRYKVYADFADAGTTHVATGRINLQYCTTTLTTAR